MFVKYVKYVILEIEINTNQQAHKMASYNKNPKSFFKVGRNYFKTHYKAVKYCIENGISQPAELQRLFLDKKTGYRYFSVNPLNATSIPLTEEDFPY
jgi:hypothetical protein